MLIPKGYKPGQFADEMEEARGIGSLIILAIFAGIMVYMWLTNGN